MTSWIIATLLVPFFFNQLDALAGKMMTLTAALRRRKWNR